ncbi:MAG: GNAT family N-acetyltransferase [Flavobacteriales bacterium]|nr:GNAT family N-acetyltransferase [Flavobacteriales bacterium]
MKQLRLSDLSRTIEILRQDSLRYSDGNYPEEGWISHFLTDERCVALGLWVQQSLVAVLITEKLSLNGCIMWFIAVDPEHQGHGYGSILLEYFEKHAHEFGIQWVFLNATKNSLNFYKKHGYITGESAVVYEHYKDLT